MNPLLEKYTSTLMQVERLPADGLARYQAGLVERIVRHASENSAFYWKRLSCLFKDGEIDLRKWRDVPVLSRAEAAANIDAMRTSVLPEQYGLTTEVKTTGTVGVPLQFTRNGLNVIASWAAWLRFMQWHGAEGSEALAVIRPSSGDEALSYPAGKSRAAGENGRRSARYDLDFLTPSPQQVEWLGRQGAPHLVTTPSNAMAIAFAAGDAGRTLGIERVFAYGETVARNARQVVQERLGARFASIYSCEEAGPLAAECSHAPVYHLLPYQALVEVLNANGTPAAPGEAGDVVITSLYNYATPFIRYAIGDVAVAADRPCACGRAFGILEHVIGRTRSSFLFPDGTRKWPRSFDVAALQAAFPFREFQMVQLDKERIELRYVTDGIASLEQQLLDRFAREYLHPAVRLTAVRMESVPRGKGGKFEQFVSYVSED